MSHLEDLAVAHMEEDEIRGSSFAFLSLYMRADRGEQSTIAGVG